MTPVLLVNRGICVMNLISDWSCRQHLDESTKYSGVKVHGQSPSDDNQLRISARIRITRRIGA
jgi:hypothetical protein